MQLRNQSLRLRLPVVLASLPVRLGNRYNAGSAQAVLFGFELWRQRPLRPRQQSASDS